MKTIKFRKQKIELCTVFWVFPLTHSFQLTILSAVHDFEILSILIAFCVCLKRLFFMFLLSASRVGDFITLNWYSWFWKFVNMVNQGGGFSFFQGVHVRIDIKTDISISIRPTTTKFGKQIHLEKLTETRLMKQVLTAPNTIFSFSKCSENMVFPKKLRWKKFLVLSGKVIFLFLENIKLFFRRKIKDDFSQKKYRELWYFLQMFWKDGLSNKNRTGIWSFLLYYLETWYFFFSKIWYYSLDEKWKMIFLKKIHGNIILSSNTPKDGLSKQIALEYDLSFGKYDIFSLDGKWKMIVLKKYTEIWYFLYKC